MQLDVFIDVVCEPCVDAEAFCRKACGAVAVEMLALGKSGCMQVNVKLSDDVEVRGLNRQFRGKDKSTNVLSFPDGTVLPDGVVQLGDIVLARETLLEEAKTQEKLIENHLMHLVVHGLLHLLGYDHGNDVEAGEMEALEVKILASLCVNSPY